MFYRLYTRQTDGHISTPASIIEADTDDAAIAEAKRYVDGHDLELWHEKRLVARLPHQEK
jgi:hypothetical protein